MLYQSAYFQDRFPDDNRRFSNVVLVEPVADDRDASLLRMREAMLSRSDLVGAVFIGGMEGVEIEYELFRRFHPNATALPVASPGGAARRLAERLGYSTDELGDVDFARLFHTRLGLQGLPFEGKGGADGS